MFVFWFYIKVLLLICCSILLLFRYVKYALYLLCRLCVTVIYFNKSHVLYWCCILLENINNYITYDFTKKISNEAKGWKRINKNIRKLFLPLRNILWKLEIHSRMELYKNIVQTFSTNKFLTHCSEVITVTLSNLVWKL